LRPKSERKNAPIANLPAGVGLTKIRNGRGVEYWQVRLGITFTGSEVVRKKFRTLDEARDWVFGKKDALVPSPANQLALSLPGLVPLRARYGSTAFDVSPQQLTAAVANIKRLEGHKVDLNEAVAFFIKHALPEGGERTFVSLREEFLTRCKSINCKETTVVNYQTYLKVVIDAFGDAKLHEIRQADIEKWLLDTGWSTRTRLNYLRVLTTLFNFAQSRGYCAANPAAKIPRPMLDQAPPGILTPGQATALLAKAVEMSPLIVPSVAIGLFAGIRRSEICALEWSEIDLAGRHIEVTGAKAKTRQRRLVTISDNLASWLTRFPGTGRVFPYHVDTFGNHLWQVSRAAGITSWPQNALRHSFGSYFYARTKNENLTAAEMGNSPAMVFRHYRALVRGEEVQAYWRL
jgi:integrase